MIFGLAKDKKLLDEASVAWLFDAFGWALRNLDADVFYNETILVVPSNEYFPGRVNSVQGMAQLIFDQVKSYAGMSHWPSLLVDQISCSTISTPKVVIEGPLRGSKGMLPAVVDESQRLTIPYDPALVGNPEALIASYAHSLAHYLGSMAGEEPPGGKENWPHLVEVVAIFMGFGVMFANTAFTFRGSSCGSCRGPSADRYNYLSQYDVTYALAIFCVLKQIANKAVVPHLKRSLRAFFKASVREIQGRKDVLARLKSSEALVLTNES